MLMYKLKDAIRVLTDFAPPAYQESYDNAGLITGNPDESLKGILISLDCVESVIDEAIEKGCNLVVAHHPIVFAGLKQLNGKNYVERTVIKAIRHDIAIYAIHTNLDNVKLGVNRHICDRLGLVNTHILQPKKGMLTKLTAYVPKTNTSEVLEALYQAGAGHIGAYDRCSFKTTGKGTFRPLAGAVPHLGEVNKEEQVSEDKIELVLPKHLEHKVLGALKSSHPYEEVAYYLTALENQNQDIGAGMIGMLSAEYSYDEFFSLLCEKMQLSTFKHTKALPNKKVKTVAVCGGAGSFLLKQAIRQKADVYVSADFKYHEYFDAEEAIVIADIGHYESEVFTKDLIYSILREKLTNIALILSELDTNPIKYYNV